MAENSKIEWTHHTFNPWIGCTKVSPACDHCYAETWDKRYNGGAHWGAKAPRRRTSAALWQKPVKWNKEAAAKGIRYRVFCASLADVFDNQVPDEWRADLWALIAATPNLDWLLLTKRPQNIKKMLPADWGDGYLNVWLGTTVENRDESYKRIPHLLRAPAFVRFLSMEPLLGAVDLTAIGLPVNMDGVLDALRGHSWIEHWHDDQGKERSKEVRKEWGAKIDWVITGGESGEHFRPANPDWFRALRDQCAGAGTPFLFKQWEGASQAAIKKLGRALDGVVHDGYPVIGHPHVCTEFYMVNPPKCVTCGKVKS